jgi:hypothetical protein
MAMLAMVSIQTGVTNIPVSHTDITNACTIFGPNLPNIRGKTVRHKPEKVITELIDIPDDYHRLHHFVILTADVMFANGLPFLVTLSCDIQMHTAEYLPSRTAKVLGNSINKIKNLYLRGGFMVNLLLTVQEFDKVEPDIDEGIEVNITNAQEHVAEIELCAKYFRQAGHHTFAK